MASGLYLRVPKASTDATAPLLPIYETVTDEFARANGALAGSAAADGTVSKTWADASVGATTTFQIASGAAVVATGAEAAFAVLDLGQKNYTVRATVQNLNPTVASRRVGLAFRFVDASNYYRLYLDSTANVYVLQKYVALTLTTLYTSAVVPAIGDVVEAAVVDNVVQPKVNGVNLGAPFTMVDHLTATKVGFVGRRFSSGTTPQDGVSSWARIESELTI